MQETFDFGRRFGVNKEWGIRINGKYRDGDTARENYDELAKEIAIGADYLGAKYVVRVAEKQHLTLRAGVDNLFNKHYWQVQRGLYDRSFAVLGMPRTYWANMEYSF